MDEHIIRITIAAHTLTFPMPGYLSDGGVQSSDKRQDGSGERDGQGMAHGHLRHPAFSRR